MSHKPHAAVYQVDVPATFKPTRPWSFPPEILGGRMVAKNLTHGDARATTRTLNKEALASGLRDRRWAIAVLYPKAWHYRATLLPERQVVSE